MKKNYWLIAFLADSVLELATNLFPLPILHWFTKPLLMILLLGYFITWTSENKGKLRNMIIIALIMSWFGDWLLIFQEYNPIFFILGLVAFLMAHIAYIIGFLRIENNMPVVNKILIITVFIIYSTGLVYMLWPGLGDMMLPVIVYAMVLTTMGIIGIIKNNNQNILVSLGVLLFVASDSLLALNKFLNQFAYSGLFIMITYIAAQYLIIEGIGRSLTSKKPGTATA